MNRAKVVAISLIAFSVLLAIGIVFSGSYVYARVTKNQKKIEKTLNENPDIFKDYMYRMQKNIKSNWNPPEQEVSRSATVLYTINKDGTLKKCKVLKTSGVKELDEAAIEALKKSFPFEPLPEGFDGKSVDVQFTFDYNVHKKN